MSVERLNPESTASALQAAQPDAAAGFGGSKESDKRSRNENKNRKRKRDRSNNQLNVLSLEDDTVMLWKRPESADQASTNAAADRNKPFRLGEKAFAAANASAAPPLPPDPLSYQRGISTPEQYQAPHLEAEPMHQYEPHATSRTIIEPISVETHHSGEPLAAVAAFERVRPRSVVEVHELSRTARLAGSKATEVAIAIANRASESVNGAASERQLGKHELLRIAKDIKVDGVRLKDVYSAKRIDEEGLRAVVEVYLRGGDIRQQLSREVVAKEQSYERDPNLRHQRRIGELDYKRRGSQAGERAGKVWDQAKELATEQGSKLKASTQKTAQKATKLVATGAKQAQHDLIDNSNTTDWLSVTAVVVVYSIILLLLIG